MYKIFRKSYEYLLRILTFLYVECYLKSLSLMGIDKGSRFLLLRFETESQRQAYKMIGKSTFKSSKIFVIIPFRDRLELTKKCVESVMSQKVKMDFQIVLVDHLSKDPSVLTWSEEFCKTHSALLLRRDYEYNYSRLNNDAVKTIPETPDDQLILFLNNDVEFLNEDSLQKLCDTYESIGNIGALGCTLLFPNRRIQHLMAAPGIKIVAAHPYKNSRYQENSEWFKQSRPVAAVTAACLMISVKNFKNVHMFDEKLPTLGQDIDLCLKLQELGKVNWVASSVVNIHHEGATKSAAIAAEEVQYMYDKWGTFLTHNPYFSRKFSRWSEQPVLSLGEGAFPWK